MQAQHTNQIRAGAYGPLPPVERSHAAAAPGRQPAAAGGAAAAAFTVEVHDLPGSDLQMRYVLDPVANIWVASFFDATSGELVKSVPATRVMDQLAELRATWERSVDRRA